MVQTIIVFIIVAIAAGVVIFSIIKNIRPSKKENHCGGCTGCSVKNEILQNMKEKSCH